MTEEGYPIHCDNVECSEFIPYVFSYTLDTYCSWTCKATQLERENKTRHTKVSRTAKLPACDPKLCRDEMHNPPK